MHSRQVISRLWSKTGYGRSTGEKSCCILILSNALLRTEKLRMDISKVEDENRAQNDFSR